MILDDILGILKRKSDNRAYTINEKSYSYKELYKYVCNIYNFLLKSLITYPNYLLPRHHHNLRLLHTRQLRRRIQARPHSFHLLPVLPLNTLQYRLPAQ